MYEQPRTHAAPRHVRVSQMSNASVRPQSGRAGQLAGHLSALLDVTSELHRRTGDSALEIAVAALTARIAEIGASLPPRAATAYPDDLTTLHAQAFDLAGRVLVVAAAQQDTRTAVLACRRMDVHTAARESVAL
ncbi:SCO4983 family protein [Streptacidiphilus fuscans]